MIRKFLSILFIFFFLFTFQPVQESQADWKWLYGWMGIGTGDDAGKRKIDGDTTIDGALNVVGTVTVLGSGNGLKYPSEAIGVDVSGIKSDGTLSSVFIGRDYVNGDTTFTIPEFASKFEITNSARSLYGMSGIFPQAVGMWSNTGFELKGAYNYDSGDVDAITATYSGIVHDMWDTEDRANFTDLTWGDVTPAVDANGYYPQASYCKTSSSGLTYDTDSDDYYLPVEIPLSHYDTGETITNALLRRSSVSGAGVVPYASACWLKGPMNSTSGTGDGLATFEHSSTITSKDDFKTILINSKITDDTTRDQTVTTTRDIAISRSNLSEYFALSSASDAGFYVEFDVQYEVITGEGANSVRVTIGKASGGFVDLYIGTGSYAYYCFMGGQTYQSENTDTSNFNIPADSWYRVRLEILDATSDTEASFNIKTGALAGDTPSYGTAWTGPYNLSAADIASTLEVSAGTYVRLTSAQTTPNTAEVKAWFKNIRYGRVANP